MRTPLSTTCLLALGVGFATFSTESLGQQIGTGFTYQGELSDGAGVPASGLIDLRFRLYDQASTQVGATLCADNVVISSGRFSVQLDFGSQYHGQKLYLEMDVRSDAGLSCANAAGFTTLAPRQELTIAPNAGFSLKSNFAVTAADASGLAGQPASFYTNASNLNAGTISDSRLGTSVVRTNQANTFGLFDNTFNGKIGIGTVPSEKLSVLGNGAFSGSVTAGTFSGSGSGLVNLNASSLSSGLIPDPRLAGTYSQSLAFTNAANTFIGTHSGNGAGLTSLNAGNLLTGLVPDGRLAATYTQVISFTNVNNAFSGNGANIYALNASLIGSGTLGSARLAGIYSQQLALTNALNAFTGDGSQLSNLNASSLTSGTVQLARLPSVLARLDAANTFAVGDNLFNNKVGIGSPGALTHRLQVQSPDNQVLRLLGSGASFAEGAKLNFGDADNAFISEDADDKILISTRLRTAVMGGNMGVGTLSPAARLHVAGDVRTDGAFTYSTPQTRYAMVGAAAFSSSLLNSSDSYFYSQIDLGVGYQPGTDGGVISLGGNALVRDVFVAHVELPDGAVITQIQIYAVDRDPSTNLKVQLTRSSPIVDAPSTGQLMCEVTSAGVTTGTEAFFTSSVSNATIDNSTYRYQLTVFPTGDVNSLLPIRLNAVRIRYTVTTPLP